jgi:outer membrane protein insertion porin family
MISNLSLEFAGLGGTNRFLRYGGDSRVFFPAFWGSVISLNGSLGYIQGLGKTIPIDDKFYLGGINTIRGYAGRTVSPTVPIITFSQNINGVGSFTGNNVFLGGDTAAFANLEYVFPVLKDAGLKGVVFLDAGNADNGIDKVFSHILASYGVGLRWLSPMGPLRVEYGIPFNPRKGIDKSSGRFEFSMGSFF